MWIKANLKGNHKASNQLLATILKLNAETWETGSGVMHFIKDA